MKGAFGMVADEGIDSLVRDGGLAGLDFAAFIAGESRLAKYFASEANAGAELHPIIGMRHVVEPDERRVARIRRAQMHVAPRFGSHRPHVNLETMGGCRRLAVVADGDGQEVILNIGIFDARTGADEAAGFEMIGSAQA